MPAALSYPGVYIEEIPSGVRTITGVATSVAAFVDFFRWGPTDKAVQIFGFGDFEREFGGLHPQSEASYALSQFFLNGGGQAWVVRVAAADAAAASVQIDDTVPGAGNVLGVTAASEGGWANSLRVRVDREGAPAGTFRLTVTQYGKVRGRDTVLKQESFRGLSMNALAPTFVDKVVNDLLTGSKLIRAAVNGASPALPALNGTVSGALTATVAITAGAPRIRVTISDGTNVDTKDIALPLAGSPTLATIAATLESAIQGASPANPAYTGTQVKVVDGRLVVMAGPSDPKTRIEFLAVPADPDVTTAAALKLTTAAGAAANVQEYTLGGGGVALSAQTGGAAGADGSLPSATELIGNSVAKSGINALEDADLFNILCVPRASFVASAPTAGELTPAQAKALVSFAVGYAETRRAIFLMETPLGVDEPAEVKQWLADLGVRSRNAAFYYPRIRIPDPLNDLRPRSVGAAGTVAGLYARTDASRGVWKAPAGTEAALRNIAELEDLLTDQENGALNPLAINCLRNFPIYGPVVWGARTLEGADEQASEWKYLPVRRLALFIEESLFRGTKWVVFEPNDEPLWAQIRLNIGAFMQNLFRQGAFQGRTPRDAYFVKCDAQTTTQNDINAGIVRIVVGFAPLKPAEFVVLQIQQMAGQIQT